MKQAAAIKKLSLLAAFTLKDAARAGIPRSTVARLVKREIFTRMERGVYTVATNEPVGNIGDFVVACKRCGPLSVIGGLSALFEYGLIDSVPTQVWVLVPQTVRVSDSRYRLLRTKRNLTEGVVRKDGYRITSIERSVLDALVFASKIGERNAIAAAIKALKQGDTTEKKLFQLASKIGALRYLDKYWQAIVAGLGQ
jgi:predicted transcriptional regulator of viral defense system